VREAVRAFIARYNAEWLVEKNGYLSPAALRRQHQLAAMPMAA
ncbi:MAG: IS3 family transposase, partial [Alphaproteobacteria bacterium]|nr:IS3 family transposase [Alphaproteobacteria bacterium]MBM3546419.1 IS3 family transposase [Alphaproteobacteria bacterium]